jgi:dolichyl-phosphate beta-glucosyltransferase
VSDPLVTVVLPARNEAELIEAAVLRVAEVLTDSLASYEIIVVDSASVDDTGARVERLAHPDVRVLRMERPGKGAAVGAGLRAARGRYIGFMDSDLEIGPAEVPRFIQSLTEGADAAIATKVDRAEDRPLRRRLSTVLYNAFVRLLLGTRHRDHQGGMKFFQGQAATTAKQVECDGWFWDTEVLVALAAQGSHVDELPVRAATRRGSGLSVLPVTLELLGGVIRLCVARMLTTSARS